MNRYTARTGVLEGVLIGIALVFLVPIYVLVNLSLRKQSDLSSPLLPTVDPTLDNFIEAWNTAGLAAAIGNSALVAVSTTVLVAAIGALAAYGIARSTARWSPIAFYGFLLGLLIPFQLGMIPLYKTFVASGLLGTLVPLVIIYVGLRLPFTLFLYVSFVRQIPLEYEEAAAIDGASTLRSFRSVVFPLLRPVTGTVLILNGLFAWNDFLMPLLYLSGSTTRTVPIAIYGFVGEHGTNWPLVFAALIISAIPVLVAYFIFQRTLIQGFASGVKG